MYSEHSVQQNYGALTGSQAARTCHKAFRYLLMTLNRHFQQNLPPIIVITVMSLLMTAGPGTQSLLEYQRQAILDGELWRLLSGHFIHISWSHLLLNIGGLSLIWLMAGNGLRLRDWLLSILFIALFISCALILINPEIVWYRGFSGILHGLFVLVAGHYLKTRPYFAMLLLATLLGKLFYENFSGQMPWHGDHTGFAIITQAHVYGSVAGILAAITVYLATNRS